jgi:hypothetical protein
MSYDGYSNYFEIYLKSANGTPYSLQSIARGNPESKVQTGLEYVQFVESVKVNISLFRFIQIGVVLRPTYEEALNLVSSGLLGMGFSASNKSSKGDGGDFASSTIGNYGFNQIIVKLHSSDKQSQYFKGMLLVPEFQITQDSIEIQLKAVGFMNFTRQRAVAKSYNGETYKDVLNELTKDSSNSFVVQVDPDDKVCNKFLDSPFYGNVCKKNWETLKDIFRQGNLRVIDTGSTDISGSSIIKLASMDFLKKQPVSYQFVAFRDIDPSKNIYPIISMRTSIVNYAANQTLTSIVNSISDTDKLKPKDDNQSEIGPETSKEFTTGVMSSNGSMPGKDPVDKEALGKTRSSPMNGGTYVEKLKGYWQSLVDTAASYELNTVGIPDALPGKPVKVTIGNGVKFLSGTYDCYELEHNWTNSGSETTFNLFNTLGLASVLDSSMQVIEKKVSEPSQDKTKKSSLRIG